MSAQLACPTCGGHRLAVIDTRKTNGHGAIRRRRKCEACGYRYSTIEISEAVFKSLVKSDTLAGHRAQLKRLLADVEKMIGET
jgi:transcriptional repressor NrdR